jgi:hypothetical protein
MDIVWVVGGAAFFALTLGLVGVVGNLRAEE